MPFLAGQKVFADDLAHADPSTGSMSDAVLLDGQAAATINPISNPFGTDIPYGLRVTGFVLASITTTERWDLLIESPINTPVCRIRGIEEAATQMLHFITPRVIPRADGTSTSLRFVADRIAGAGTWEADAQTVYNQFSIEYFRLPS